MPARSKPSANDSAAALACEDSDRRGIEADFGKENAATFRTYLRADYLLANGGMSSNQCVDCPPRSESSKQTAKAQSLPRQREIRRALSEADLVDTALRDSAYLQSKAIQQVLSAAKNNMVALPGQLFYSTQIPVCRWSLAKSKAADAKRGFRDRRQQTLFIDARKMGILIDRVHRELTDADLEKIPNTYHAWRGDVSGSARAPRAVSGAPAGNISSTGEAALSKSSARAPKTTREGACAPQYSDTPGFCKSATTAEIAAHGYVLTPDCYIGAEEVFGCLLACSDALRTHAIQGMTGTSGRQRVPSECVNTFRLDVPPPDIAKRFYELTTPLMATINTDSTQSRTLPPCATHRCRGC